MGAVGYRFGAFTKDAIAGITPIEQMLQTFDTQAGVGKTKGGKMSTAWGQASPLASPIVFSGLVPEVKEAFAESLRQRGYGNLIPAVAAGGGTATTNRAENRFFLAGPSPPPWLMGT